MEGYPDAVSPACPRCSAPVAPGAGAGAGGWSCPDHGPTPAPSSYSGFSEHLTRTHGFPTYLPWPLSPGWAVTDVAAVVDDLGDGDGARTRGTMTCCSGTSELDGPVDVMVVAEESGTGLGARCAGSTHDDPGPGLSDGAPLVRVRLDGRQVPLWAVSTSGSSGEWDRSVVAGEALGRWLWIIVRPASAILLLRDDWILRDVSGLGPPLVELPFAGPAPPW